MNIAIFDDQQLIIDSIVNLLQTKPDVNIIGTTTEKNTIMEILSTNNVDLLIADVLTEEEIGLGLFEDIQKKGFKTKIIVFSSISSEFIKDFLFNYGVLAFINKKEGLDQLWNTLQIVSLNSYKMKPSKTIPPKLTDKEKEIAGYLAKGLAAKEIALLTSNSTNTINNQKNHLLEKFNCTNSTELVTKLFQMGYLKV
ncbi:MAG: response regulator transcription factor [Saprospiraceae bacterium]|nr:response regulator transcription factor [Saprospiraceae bacterium]